MKNQLTRMKPEAKNMVTQAGSGKSIEMLCTECGWEGTSVVPTAPWVVFKDHQCRLILESVSTLS